MHNFLSNLRNICGQPGYEFLSQRSQRSRRGDGRMRQDLEEFLLTIQLSVEFQHILFLILVYVSCTRQLLWFFSPTFVSLYQLNYVARCVRDINVMKKRAKSDSRLFSCESPKIPSRMQLGTFKSCVMCVRGIPLGSLLCLVNTRLPCKLALHYRPDAIN